MQSEMLTVVEISKLRQLESILQPFMAAQRVLEGQKYVSNSLVAYIIHTIRGGLGNILEATEDDSIKRLIDKLLTDVTNGFNIYWRSGDTGTIFTENETYGSTEAEGDSQEDFIVFLPRS